MNRFFLTIAAFFSGAILMTYEIIGARVVSPYLGSSVYVWTSIIGVIMVSLSLGYHIGGRHADKNPSHKTIAYLYLLVASAILFTILSKDIILTFLQSSSLGLRIAPLCASVLLFAPASILLGILHPIITRLNITTLDTSGTSVAHINTISTVGSIIGTFAAGYLFIPYFGTTASLFFLVGCAIIIACLQPLRSLYKLSALLCLIIFGMILYAFFYKDHLKSIGRYTYETLYATVRVYDYAFLDTDKKVRQLLIDGNNSSSQFIGEYSLRDNYLKFYHYLANHYAKNQDKTLLLGGAGYVYPSYFVRAFPERTLHVVEIDPMLTQIAQKHFDPKLTTHPNMQIIHKDARAYLTQTKEKYDVILGDVFRSNLTIPFHLTTRESVIARYNTLTKDGIIIENIGGGRITGGNNHAIHAIYATYKDVFPTVHIYLANHPKDPSRFQNIMLVASKSPIPKTGFISDTATKQALTHLWNSPLPPAFILTDDHAPIAYLTAKK